ARLQLNHPRLGLPDFRVGFRIVDGEIELDRIVIEAPVALDRAHLIAVWLSLRPQPRLVIETGRFGDKGISFPASNGISIPSRIRILRKLAPVHPDFADGVLAFEKHQNPSGNMNDLERPDDEQNSRNTQGEHFRIGSLPPGAAFGPYPGLFASYFA